MKKNSVTSLIFIIILFLFGCLRFIDESDVRVIDVISPTKFALDMNANGKVERSEIVCISGVESFNSDLMVYNEALATKLAISYKDSLTLAYLSKNFASKILEGKFVNFVPDKVQTSTDCVGGDILVENKSYRRILLDSGYGYSDEYDFNKDRINEKIEIAKTLHPVILNRNSRKYHEIGCKFGNVSHDFSVLLKEELPDDVIPCKWCYHNDNVENNQSQKSYPKSITAGDVKIYLTDMTRHLQVRNDCSTDICQAVVENIKNAKETIDIATYGWVSIAEVDNALKQAVERGVRVRMVYDFTSKQMYYPDTLEIARYAAEAKNDLCAGNNAQSEYLMHNKFMIFDNSKVLTGSLNYSKTDFSEFNSNFSAFINSPEIAKVYTDEFEQMLSGKFHRNKEKRKNYSAYKIGDVMLQVYFSPQDNIMTDKILTYVNQAQKYIYLPVFVITHKGLEEALLKAKSRGVDVKVIVDATNVGATKSSVYRLRTSGIPVKAENYAGKLHSKSMIIDDKYVIAGSMNFSRSGEKYNDENVLIMESPRIAVFYRDFFKYLWEKIPDKYLTQNPLAESLDSIGSCFDGVDNDFDGKIDRSDEGCIAKK